MKSTRVQVHCVDDQIGVYEAPLRAALARSKASALIDLKTSDRAVTAVTEADNVEVLVLDLEYPGQEHEVRQELGLVSELRGADVGLSVLEYYRKNWKDVPVIVVTQNERMDVMLRVQKLGAFDMVDKEEVSRDLEQLVKVIGKAVRTVRAPARPVASGPPPEAHNGLLAVSQKMRKLVREIWRVAQSDVTVLLLGETGVGKEVFARTIHAESPRAGKEFVAINVKALPDTLIENELFGSEPGPFAGATRPHAGFFERADGGTLFLDEIGEASLELQAKFLRVIQHGTFDSLGGNAPKSVDVRIIAATNKDLAAAVEEGNFRRDLYMRLAVCHIEIPPLRERKRDIRPLARLFLTKSNMGHKKDLEMSEEALQQLERFGWPGNVRQLENVIERAVIYETGSVIDEIELPTGASAGITEQFRAAIRRLADAIASQSADNNQLARRLVDDFEILLYEELYALRGSWRGVGECLGVTGHSVESRLTRRVATMANLVLDGERHLEDVPTSIYAKVAEAVAAAIPGGQGTANGGARPARHSAKKANPDA